MHWLLSITFECWSCWKLGPFPGPFCFAFVFKNHQKACALRRQLSPDNVCFRLTHMYFKLPSKPVHIQKMPSTLSRKLQVPSLSFSHLRDQILPIPITKSLLSKAITWIEAISFSESRVRWVQNKDIWGTSKLESSLSRAFYNLMPQETSHQKKYGL